jgi:hypothetical protein
MKQAAESCVEYNSYDINVGFRFLTDGTVNYTVFYLCLLFDSYWLLVWPTPQL